MSTTESIGGRVALRHVHDFIHPEAMELVVPHLADRETPPLSRLVNTVWHGTLREWLQEGCEIGLFGDTTPERVFLVIFKETKQGCCQGAVDYLLANRDARIPIQRTVQQLFASPERLFFAQICYMLEDCLLSRARTKQYFYDLCSKAFHMGPKGPSCALREHYEGEEAKFLRDVGLLWCDSDFPRHDDEQFMREKDRLISVYFSRKKTRGIFCQNIFVITAGEGGDTRLRNLQEKVHQLREEVLGAPLPRPCRIIRHEDQQEWDDFVRKPARKYRCTQVNEEDHVSALFVHNGKSYIFDTRAGLVWLKEKSALSYEQFDHTIESLQLYNR